MSEDRRSARRVPTLVSIEVTNSITGDPVGRVGNLSRSGVMLICARPLREDALYQLRLHASDAGETIEIGVHAMWTQQAATNGYQWSGHRIISISRDATRCLERWIERGAG